MTKRRSDRGTFADVVATAQAEPGGNPHDGRSINRVTDAGVWDDQGRFWPAADEYLSDEEVRRALQEPGTIVGIHDGYDGPLEWLSLPDGARQWTEKVEPHFANEGDLDAGGWPRRIAYVAELRIRPDGGRLLWFDGQC